MAGTCVEKLPHDCGSRDGLQVFEDEGVISGYCYACSTYVKHPYGEGAEAPRETPPPPSSEVIAAELAGLRGLPVCNIPARKLNAKTLEHFGVTVGLSEQDGSTPAFLNYPAYEEGSDYPVGYKVNLLSPKKMWSVGRTKNTLPFGLKEALTTGAKRLYITEGEKDAMTVWQVLKKKNKNTEWADQGVAVMSLPQGASSVDKCFSLWGKLIRSHFKEFVLVYDMDEPGQKAVEATMKFLPDAKVASLPAKDANDCLVEGREKALVNAILFNAKLPTNTRIVNLSQFFEVAKQPAKWGYSWPWPKMTDLTRGIRPGETIYIGAGVKMGKSTILTNLLRHFIMEHEQKVFLAAPEADMIRLTKQVLGQAAGAIFDDPKVKYPEEEYERACQLVGDKVEALDLYQHLGWETLKQDIISAAAMGCKFVMIDPITNLTNGMSSSEANSVLQGFAQEVASMSKDLDISTFLFAHLLRPEWGPPHERGGVVMSSQFAGSRGMMRSCHYMIGLEGNKSPDLSDQEIVDGVDLKERQKMRRLVILEDRPFGESDSVPLYFNEHTRHYVQMEER